MAMQEATSPLFTGPIASGKWTEKEERRALHLIRNFLAGNCPDCEHGNPTNGFANTITIYF